MKLRMDGIFPFAECYWSILQSGNTPFINAKTITPPKIRVTAPLAPASLYPPKRRIVPTNSAHAISDKGYGRNGKSKLKFESLKYSENISRF